MYVFSATGNEQVDRELRKIEQGQNIPSDFIFVKETHAALAKPRKGMIIFADGTNFDPGQGSGLYLFITSWVKLLHHGVVTLAQQTSAPSTSSPVIALADGVSWNPGAGQGIYAYYGGAWNHLG